MPDNDSDKLLSGLVTRARGSSSYDAEGRYIESTGGTRG